MLIIGSIVAIFPAAGFAFMLFIGIRESFSDSKNINL